MENIITLKNITKKFGDFKALDDVNLKIEKGQIFGFIGPNGAGKTTTIRILLGSIKPTSGDASIFGLDAFNDVVEIHKNIAYVPSDANIWPNLTGGEVIDLLLNLHGNIDSDKKNELIQDFNFDPSKKSANYSRGNRQKILLISALATDADLYIFDEPTTGLDPLMESVFLEHLIRIKNEGKTVLLSSHILSEIEKACDHVAIIKEGKIIESGSMDDLTHLNDISLKIKTKEKIKELEKIDKIYDTIAEGNEITFSIAHEYMPEVIKYISQFNIESIETNNPSLEDLFMRHYKIEDHHEK